MADEGEDRLGRLTKEAIRDLLGKGWLTHDGMWFINAAAELGVDRANELNRAAIHGMAEIEVRRLLEALDVHPAGLATSGDVCRFLTDGLAVLLPDSVATRIRLTAPDEATVRVEWENGECFAYKGMRRAGLLDGYECGVVYRIECWLKALGIRHQVVPAVGRCQMRVDGRCASDIRLVFDSQTSQLSGRA
jgi:hypothetical protein